MFKKCLLVSIVLHILLIAGAGLNSPQPSAQVNPPYFQLITANASGSAGTGGQTGEKGTTTVPISKGRRGTAASLNMITEVTKVNSLQPLGKESEEITAVDSDSTAYLSQGLAGEQSNAILSNSPATGDGTGGPGDNMEGAGGGDGISGMGDGPGGGTGNSQRQLIKDPVRIYYPTFYPQLARKKGWEGKVKLEAALGKDGRIGKVKPIQSSGYKVLDDAAIKAVKKWRYQPATQDGKPIEWTLLITVPFRLED